MSLHTRSVAGYLLIAVAIALVAASLLLTDAEPHRVARLSLLVTAAVVAVAGAGIATAAPVRTSAPHPLSDTALSNARHRVVQDAHPRDATPLADRHLGSEAVVPGDPRMYETDAHTPVLGLYGAPMRGAVGPSIQLGHGLGLTLDGHLTLKL